MFHGFMGKKLLNPRVMGVAQEDLAEIVLAHQVHQAAHPFLVQFVEDVVQEQDRELGTDVRDILHLSQAQRQ